MEASFSGNKFTWCNKRRGTARVHARLDRIFYNDHWTNKIANTTYCHLNRTYSDHAPMLLNINNTNKVTCQPFKFQNFWTKHQSFCDVVKDSWDNHCEGNHIQKMCTKLKRLRQRLKEWNKSNFGNIFGKIKQAEQEVEQAEIKYSDDNSDNALIKYKHAQANLKHQLAIEDAFWKQKANLKYVLEGDSNTRYFHSIVKGRRAKNFIYRIKNNQDNWLEDQDKIKDHIIDFFKDQLTQDEYRNIPDSMLIDIPNMVTTDDNEALIKMPNDQEIKNAIWELNDSSAAVPDGYTGLFYKAC